MAFERYSILQDRVVLSFTGSSFSRRALKKHKQKTAWHDKAIAPGGSSLPYILVEDQLFLPAHPLRKLPVDENNPRTHVKPSQTSGAMREAVTVRTGAMFYESNQSAQTSWKP